MALLLVAMDILLLASVQKTLVQMAMVQNGMTQMECCDRNAISDASVVARMPFIQGSGYCCCSKTTVHLRCNNPFCSCSRRTIADSDGDRHFVMV